MKCVFGSWLPLETLGSFGTYISSHHPPSTRLSFYILQAFFLLSPHFQKKIRLSHLLPSGGWKGHDVSPFHPRIFSDWSSWRLVRLISKILEDPSEALELCRHNFGHHVVQLVLERGHPRQGTRGIKGARSALAGRKLRKWQVQRSARLRSERNE